MAEQIWVFWSVSARRSPFVRAALELVAEIEDAERAAEPPGPQEKTRLVTVPLDDTVLTHPLRSPKAIARLTGDHPVQAALYSGLNLLGGLGSVGLGVWGWLDGFQGPLWWVAVVGLTVLALAVSVAQLARRAELVFTAGAIYQRGAWLARATVGEILELSERVLSRIYGRKLLGWRAVLVSAMVGTGTMLPLAALWYWNVVTQMEGAEAGAAAMDFARRAVSLTAPLALFNLLFDLLSMLVTRGILHRLLRDPQRVRVALGLGLDAGLVLLAAALPFVFNGIAGESNGYVGQVMTNPHAIGAHLLLLISGGLRLENIGRGILAAGLLMPALSVITGCLPSLVHGSLLLVASLNRALGGAPLRFLGWALRGFADRPAGPQEALVPLGAASLGLWTLMTAQGSDAAPSTVWVNVPQETCAEGCTVGSPEGESNQGDERARSVHLRTGYEIQHTELSQGQWAWVMRGAAEAKLEVWGLPNQPAVYRGRHLPVDGVSWCEAARFANLWTLVARHRAMQEGREEEAARWTPAYSIATSLEDNALHGLPGCEAGATVTWNLNSTGYRLPTEVEWEVAARGCRPKTGCSAARFVLGDQEAELLRAAWVRVNSGWRPHVVASREPNALGLRDMLGNVWEWTWDVYTSLPTEGLDPAVAVGAVNASGRVLRGGSWDDVPAVASASNRGRDVPGVRFEYIGFRLVRSAVPPPSGSGL